MPVINVPPGCAGLDPGGNSRPLMADRPGGHVTVSDEQADRLGRQDGGVLSGRPGMVLATRNGRWCTACRRLWQAWSARCPKCGAETVPE